MKKRILSMLMAIVMVMALLPTMNITAEAAGPHSNHCLCGTTHQNIGDHTENSQVTFQEYKFYWGSNSDTPPFPTSGCYYMTTQDSSLTTISVPEVTLSGNLTICLNGMTLTSKLNSQRYMFDLNGHTLTITDCKGTGSVSIVYGYGNVIVASGSSSTHKVNLYNGTIVGNGGESAIIVRDDATLTFNQYGGTVCARYTDAGNGITVDGKCVFAQYDGTFCNFNNGIRTRDSNEGEVLLKTMPNFTGCTKDIYFQGSRQVHKVKFATKLDPIVDNPTTVAAQPSEYVFTNGWNTTFDSDNFSDYFAPAEGYEVQPNGNELRVRVGAKAITKGAEVNGTFEIKKTSKTDSDIIDRAYQNDYVYVHAAPNPGYAVGSVTYVGTYGTSTATKISTGVYRFTMPSKPTTVNVNFIIPVSSLTLNETSKTLTIDETFTLTPTVAPENASKKDISWTSSNWNVATVDSIGNVTAKGAGTATITATAADGSGVSAACTVTVNAVTYTITKASAENGTVTVNKTTAAVGEEVTITPTPAPGYEVNTITVYKTGEESTTVDVNEDNEFTMPAYPVTVSVTFKAIVSHSHCICGATHASVGDHDEPVSTTFTRVTTQEELQTAATSGGSVYLANDIELTSTISVAEGKALNLCLNDMKLYYEDGGNISIFTLEEDATLNLTDCGTTERPGYVDGDTYLWTPGTAVDEDDIPYNLTGGLVTGGTGCKTNPNSSYSYGGAVYANPGSKFNLYGGNIAGNDTTYAGGGVCGENASMAVYGGCMVGNDTGAISIWDLDGYDEIFPTLSIYGGELEYNRAPSNIDGEIDVDGPITMTGGTVTAEHSNLAMKLFSNAFTMTGGTVTCNQHWGTAVQFNGITDYTETQEGNTVYRTYTPAKVTLSGGTINAPSSGYGLALYSGYSDLYLSGAPVLTDNDSYAAIAIYRAEENDTWEEAGTTYVYCCSTGHIVLTGQLSWQDPVLIEVFDEDSDEYADPATLDFTSGWNTYMRDADPADYFTSGHYSAEVAKNAQTGELKMAESYYVILSDADGFEPAETEYGSYNVDKYFAAEGSTVTITAIPIAGYEVGRVKVSEFLPGPMSFSSTEEQGEESTEISVTPNGNGTYSFVMPAYAVEVQVTFKVKTVVAPSGSSSNPSYPVVADKSEAVDGTIGLSASNAKKGSTVTVTVTPDKYYGVEKVIVRDESGKEIQVTENADGTYSFKMPSGKVTVEAVYVWENPFVDVKEGTYYIDPVEWALKNDITAGTSKTTFSPNSPCTRAQMVTFLWNSAGRPEPSGDDCAFNDVSKDSYYEKAVRWAYENGITKGTSETTFSPDMECSRAHMATFLCKMADGKAESDTNAFVDVKSNAYYADSVQWAVENGITKGTGNNKYSPDATCTRGQMVTFLYQYYNK